MRRQRAIDESVHQVTEFSSLDHFLMTRQFPTGISTIYDNGLPIDILVIPAESDITIFFFHGAIEPDFTVPVLSGLGISGGLKANRVFISDPSLVLDESLLLGWYAGNKLQSQLQETLKIIIAAVASSLDSDRLIFFGGSGGGFASLYFAHHFDNSLALVFNPQTDIAKYTQRAIRDYTSKAFNVPAGTPDPLSHLPSSITQNLCGLYKEPTTTTVAYMQNQNDTAHVRSHLQPFRMAMHADTEFLTLVEPWREGHTPPPKELLVELLDSVVLSSDWASSLFPKGFKQSNTV